MIKFRILVLTYLIFTQRVYKKLKPLINLDVQGIAELWLLM